ncbi:AbrB/MazE/SpoVT family DNA-binding domain-containing protein [Jiangella alba]|uniref:AbrB/MazE/SpoVT family DNA-binding domain-containing protein n=1 Tax=Jiangella alba TaxID=561176 RepID=UPI00115FC1C6|nr:AbrB/MazE/SpoVT family DNA-binding domain-containing protein [Jiangella alba]
MSAYALTLSADGQVSIPAQVLRRWNAARVLVIDQGDRIIVRPIPDDPIEAVIGKYSGGADGGGAAAGGQRRGRRARDRPLVTVLLDGYAAIVVLKRRACVVRAAVPRGG